MASFMIIRNKIKQIPFPAGISSAYMFSEGFSSNSSSSAFPDALSSRTSHDAGTLWFRDAAASAKLRTFGWAGIS